MGVGQGKVVGGVFEGNADIEGMSPRSRKVANAQEFVQN